LSTTFLRDGYFFTFTQSSARDKAESQRPFTCRRIYSLETCSRRRPPILNRRVMELGDDTIRSLQMLDETGYSGHISFILHMLDAPVFRNTYLNGAFKPEEIADFGKTHQIIINRMASANGDSPG
jgi:uncharacterized protein